MDERRPLADPSEPGLLGRIPAPRSVVVMRPSRIGDLVCATPAFHALRRRLPQAQITLIGLPFARDLVERSPDVDRFETFPGFPGIAEQWFDAGRTTAFLEEMQRRRFDLVLQLYGSGRYSNTFALLLGARFTAGFVRSEGVSDLLDAALPLPTRGHEVDRVLTLPKFLGARSVDRRPTFGLLERDHAAARQLLAGLARPIIGVHAGASDAGRRWGPERFASAAVGVRDAFGGTVVAVGGAGERDLTRRIAELAGPAADLGGRTSLPVLGAVVRSLDVLLTTDSGPAHLAYALGTPSVTVFGPSDPVRSGPVEGGPHAIVRSESHRIEDVAVHAVVATASRLLAARLFGGEAGACRA